MAIKISRQRRSYSAEVTPPHGNWQSSAPTRADDLARELWRIGCDPADVVNAFKQVDIIPSIYYEVADQISPLLVAALEGRRIIPPQLPYVESWLAETLFGLDSQHYLEEVIEGADAINHAIPNADEISWAFLRIRARGWLVIVGDKYGISREGRRILDTVYRAGPVNNWIERIEKWILSNPAPGFENTVYAQRQKEWFMDL